MALKPFTLPVCDVCGEPWFPEKGPARDDPRAYDQQQRRLGLPPLRCGKCKSFGWDRLYKGDLRRKDPHEVPMEPTGGKSKHRPAPKKRAPVKAGKRKPIASLHLALKKRCNHGLLHCAQCHTNQVAVAQ